MWEYNYKTLWDARNLSCGREAVTNTQHFGTTGVWSKLNIVHLVLYSRR